MRAVYFIILTTFSSLASEESVINLDQCYSETVQYAAYNCIYDKSVQLKNEYNNTFASLIKKIKKEKAQTMNYRDLNAGLLNSKKEWDKFLESECSTEANVYQKGTGFHQSIYDTCRIQNYSNRINYYRKFEFKWYVISFFDKNRFFYLYS